MLEGITFDLIFVFDGISRVSFRFEHIFCLYLKHGFITINKVYKIFTIYNGYNKLVMNKRTKARFDMS